MHPSDSVYVNNVCGVCCNENAEQVSRRNGNKLVSNRSVLIDVVLTKLTEHAVQTSNYVLRSVLGVRYASYAFKNTRKTNTRIGRHVLSPDVRSLVSVNDLRVYFQSFGQGVVRSNVNF